MEWVETTGKTVDEARDRALEELGVAEDEAEIDVLDEPKAGLFGLIRGEARIRARVRPAEVRPKIDRRRGRRKDSGPANGQANGGASGGGSAVGTVDDVSAADQDGDDGAATAGGGGDDTASDGTGSPRGRGGERRRRSDRASDLASDRAGDRGDGRSNDDGDARGESDDVDDVDEGVDPAAVGAAAVSFMEGLVEAFGLEATVELDVDGTELDVRVDGSEVGLMIGPGGRTLLAVQDLARVAAQRRLGDHDTRLRIDVAGYRERRREALERFAQSVAEQVVESGRARALELMPSADRKVVHDVLVGIDGVSSYSEGDDPDRRVVVVPA